MVGLQAWNQRSGFNDLWSLVASKVAGYLAAFGFGEEARAIGRRVIARTSNRRLRILTIEHLALAALLEGDLERAARLYGYVDAALVEIEYKRDFSERYAYERLSSALRNRLGGRLADLTWLGVGLSDDEAARLAVA